MSEKEKETIEDCKELVQELKQHKDKDFIGRLYYRNKPVEDILSVLLNLIEKQQKELNNLKEIEKSHKEENGKLRVELEQEKEKNKELEEKLKIAKQLYNDACVCIATECVEKDKIKDKIEETNNEKLNYSEDEYYLENEIKGYAIDKLKELLEEK